MHVVFSEGSGIVIGPVGQGGFEGSCHLVEITERTAVRDRQLGTALPCSVLTAGQVFSGAQALLVDLCS